MYAICVSVGGNLNGNYSRISFLTNKTDGKISGAGSTSEERYFGRVLPIFLATKVPISLSNVAQRAQLKFFSVAQRAQ